MHFISALALDVLLKSAATVACKLFRFLAICSNSTSVLLKWLIVESSILTYLQDPFCNALLGFADHLTRLDNGVTFM